MISTVARNRVRDRLRRESIRPGKELAAVIDEIRARTDHADPSAVRDELFDEGSGSPVNCAH